MAQEEQKRKAEQKEKFEVNQLDSIGFHGVFMVCNGDPMRISEKLL